MADKLAKDLFVGNILGQLRELFRRVERLEVSTISEAVAETRYLKVVAKVVSTWDPGSLANQAATSTTVSVTGAVVTDVVLATHDQIGANDVLISAHVQADGTVRVTILNYSGGVLDIASGQLVILVLR